MASPQLQLPLWKKIKKIPGPTISILPHEPYLPLLTFKTTQMAQLLHIFQRIKPVNFTARAGVIFFTLSSCELALAVQQMTEIAVGDNPGLELPSHYRQFLPSYGFSTTSSFSQHNQINRMCCKKESDHFWTGAQWVGCIMFLLCSKCICEWNYPLMVKLKAVKALCFVYLYHSRLLLFTTFFSSWINLTGWGFAILLLPSASVVLLLFRLWVLPRNYA